MALTARNIIDAIRNQLDEDSDADIKDKHILASANRAMTSGMDTLVAVFPDPMTEFKLMTVGADGVVDLPEDIFEDRVLHVDLIIQDIPHRLAPVTHVDIHDYEISGTTSYPDVWAVFGRKLYLKPVASEGQTIRVWYVKELQPLVKPQGRITRIGSDYLVVDSYGGGLTNNADELNSYINVIGFNTGEVKWSGQVKSIVGDRINLTASPARSKVLNQNISSDLASADVAIREDDYICTVDGTCISYMPQILENFLIQHAIIEMKNRLGYDSMPDRAVLSSYEKKLKAQWKSRPAKTKVQLTTTVWNSGRSRRGWR